MVAHVIAVNVRIPAITVDRFVVDRDKPHACFDEPPGHQGRLTEQVPAVTIADAVGFLANVQGTPRPRRCNQRESASAKLVMVAHTWARGIEQTPLSVELVKQVLTGIDAAK